MFDLYEPVQIAMIDGRYLDALALAERLEAQRPTDQQVWLNNAGVFIDIGTAVGVLPLVEEGIARLEAEVGSVVEPKTRREAMLLYNLANGYTSRLQLQWADIWKAGGETFSLHPDTRRAKTIHRRLDRRLDLVPSGERPTRPVNFGNLLDHAGRSVEALDQYESALAIDPRHPAALAESTMAAWHSSLVPEEHFEGHLLELCRRAARANRYRTEHAAVVGREGLQRNTARLAELQHVAEHFGGIAQLRTRVRVAETHAAWPADRRSLRVARDWARQRLFLSFNLRLPRSPLYWRDDLGLTGAMLPAIADPHVCHQLVDRMSEMRTSYQTARFLLTRAQQKSRDVDVLAGLTQFPSGVTEWGLRIGLVKAAYREAADILDKAGGFLNLLFGWGIDDRKIYFTRLWYERNDPQRALRGEVQQALHRNPYVRALFDLSLDWRDAGDLQHLQELRHALTHRYVPVYVDPAAVTGAPANLPTPTAMEIRQLAHEMLRTARAAILYTIGATLTDQRSRAHVGQRLGGGFVRVISMPASEC